MPAYHDMCQFDKFALSRTIIAMHVYLLWLIFGVWHVVVQSKNFYFSVATTSYASGRQLFDTEVYACQTSR